MPQLAELEYDANIHNSRFAADAKLYHRFFLDVLPDEERTKAEKKKCFRDVEMITIMIPGNKKEVRTREVRDEDRERFSGSYAKFRAGIEQVPDGYPIREWSQCSSPAMQEELKYMGFQTVEQLAGASDAILSQYAGLRMLQKRAKEWLEVQAERYPLEKLAAEKADAEEKIDGLQRQITEMAETIAKLKPAKAARGG